MNFSKSLEKDQDVELLVAKDKKYNFKCRNGNWPHEELVEKVSSYVITKITIFNISYFLLTTSSLFSRYFHTDYVLHGIAMLHIQLCC